MELFLIYILFCSHLINVDANYILIPFDSMIYNPKNDVAIKEDALSSLFSEDVYFNLTIGNPKQTIKVFIRLDQYELRIKEPKYISSLSNSFKYHLINQKIICKENFYFTTLNTLEDLNNFIHSDKINKHKKENELIKGYKNVSFVYLNDTTNNQYLEKELLYYEYDKIIKYNYGMLGLKSRKIRWDTYPQFVEGLNDLKLINSSVFSFYFNKDKNEEHLGYLIIGEKFIDKETEYEEINKTNFALRGGSISWDLSFETIYSKSNDENLNSFYERSINAELKIELSYILGSGSYKAFIEKEFFNYLIEKKICEYKELKIDLSYRTFVCDGKSIIFLDYYNNKFPNLVFILRNIDDKLTFTKEDLFFKNTNDKYDTNFYFSIFFHSIKTTSWELGRIFLKKYRLSFSYDASLIYYHKSKLMNDIKENNIIQDDSNNNSQILKIFLIVFLGVIIFIFGFLFHKSIIKLPRKIKANELDDGYCYQNQDENKKINNDLDINNDCTISKEKRLYLELGTQNN